MECWACQHINLHSLVRINESPMRRKVPRCRELEKLLKMVKKTKYNRRNLLLWSVGHAST